MIYRRAIRILCLMGAFVFAAWPMLSQTRADLERKKQSLQTEINNLQIQLNTTSKSKNTTRAQVEMLKKQIMRREELIGTYNDELNRLSQDIRGNEQVQTILERQLDANKSAYASTVRFNYLHAQDASPPLYLINKADMQSAILQKLYATRIHKFESNRIVAIRRQRIALGYVVKSLKEQQDAKMKFLQEQQQQKIQLTADKQLHDKKYKELLVTEKTLHANLLAKKAAAAKLNKQIEAIIRKEIEAASKKAKAETLAKAKSARTSHKGAEPTTAGSKPETRPDGAATVKAPALTTEMSKLAIGFEGYKGRLTWPANGTVVETFGTHPHPEVKDIVINNNGIDISLNAGTLVSAVYEGAVVAVISNAGYQNAVLVQHGDYYTVYANLATVNVVRGDKVKTRQALGTIYTQPDTHKSTLHFEIWKGTTKLNPQAWLGR